MLRFLRSKAAGGGPNFLDSRGGCWTAAYINEGGNVVAIFVPTSRPKPARQTYEALINARDDDGTKKTLIHLLTREVTHANMFMKALASMDKLTDPIIGNVPADDTVKLVFNLSQGDDVRGPWNPDFEYIGDPSPQGGMRLPPINPDDETHASRENRGQARRSRCRLQRRGGAGIHGAAQALQGRGSRLGVWPACSARSSASSALV